MRKMEIIPAIDISNGKCVRLYKGRKGSEKVYYENPLQAIDYWISQGATRLHFVDLDGAWDNSINNELLLNMISQARGKTRIQVGGGIRSLQMAAELVKLGVERIIIGTLAIENPNVVGDMAESIGSEHIMVAIDYRSNKIATHGWTQQKDIDPFTFGRKIIEKGAGFILFTSIEADGTFKGPDLTNIKKMVKFVNRKQVYIAGGIRNTEDLEDLKKIGVKGVIVGKAFYENKLPFSVLTDSYYND